MWGLTFDYSNFNTLNISFTNLTHILKKVNDMNCCSPIHVPMLRRVNVI